MHKRWISDTKEIEVILEECDSGVITTINSDGSPYAVPVNYVYFDGKIYIHSSSKGMKIENIKHDPRVCFVAYIMDGIIPAKRADNFSTSYRSIIIFGNARIINNHEEKIKPLNALIGKYAKGMSFEPMTEECISATTIIEIEIDKMTGKRNSIV